MMDGLVIFLAGLILAVMTEEAPKWVRTMVWVALVVIGVLMGALSRFRA